MPWDHQYAYGCGDARNGTRRHERDHERSAHWATWSARGDCCGSSLALQFRRKLRHRSRTRCRWWLHRTITANAAARISKNEHNERTMPPVIVKLWLGKSEQQKTRLAEAITKNVMDILHYGEESVSVAMEEIRPQDWIEKVYKPDIKGNLDKLYKKPGYDANDL